MIPALHNAELPDRVCRPGREPDPWKWPDWSYASPDGTFGNRFDDPEGQYRVLYASAERGPPSPASATALDSETS